MEVMKKPCTAVLAAISICAVPAFAAPPTGFYLGPEVASARLAFDGSSYSKTRMNWGGHIGWQFNQVFGAELGYHGVSRISESGTYGGTVVDIDMKYGAIMATVVAQHHFNDRYSVFARVGGFTADQNSTVTVGSNSWLVTASPTRLLYGIGFGANIDRARLRLEYRRTSFEFADSSSISLGISWFFSKNK